MDNMEKEKWRYIRLISKRGSAYGGNGGVLALLEWCGKRNTMDVTLEEAKAFWELAETPKPPEI